MRLSSRPVAKLSALHGFLRFTAKSLTVCLALTATSVGALTLTGVQSRKGAFDLPIDFTQAMSGNVTVEPRIIGGGHVIVFQFDGPISSTGTLAVVDNTLTTIAGASAAASVNDVVVTLSVLPDNKRARISLTSVNGIIGMDFTASMGFLVGDVNNTQSVNSSDISSVKARSGLATSAANFKFDVNATGAINSSDISAVKARSGLVLPIVNAIPVVNAGANQTIVLPASATLAGSATDDGLPNPPGALTLLWSKFSGPGNVTFGNAAAGSTSASFSTAGAYVLRLSANDGQATGTADVSVSVSPDPTVLPGLFEKPSPWNKDISMFPVAARSAAITSALIGFGGWGNGNRLQIDFSIAVLTADSTTPRGTISAAPGYYLPDGDATPLQMPLPLNGNTEGNAGYACDRANEDCHVLVVERTEKKLYELYNATGAASSMIALGAFVWDLTRQYPDVLRGDQCTSADAAGLPMAALIPTADEVAAGEVPHALRFILPNPRMKEAVYVRPATHAGGPSSINPDAPPYGVRFRLKASFDETTFNAAARVILRAMKKYGMILSDGGNIALTFADDRLSTAKWDALNITAQTFNNIPVSQFEVVDLGAEIALTFNCVRAP